VNRIPVFQTVSRTYGFLLGDIATILQVTWLPMLVVAVLNFYVGGASMDEAIAAKGEPGASQMAGASYLVGFLALLANVMVLVALLRVVMFGQRPGNAPFYLWFGMTEARLVLTYILLTIAAIAGVIGGGILLGLLGAVSAGAGAAGSVVGLLSSVLIVVIVWVFLKLVIVPAVVVAENNLGVERAWELMKGNALRMFGVLVLVYIPLGAVALLAKAVQGWQLELLKAIRLNWLEVSILNFVSSIFSAALLAGVAGNAWLTLSGEQAERPVDDGHA
jgi:hypothetical protein